eukprot:g11049.t1
MAKLVMDDDHVTPMNMEMDDGKPLINKIDTGINIKFPIETISYKTIHEERLDTNTGECSSQKITYEDYLDTLTPAERKKGLENAIGNQGKRKVRHATKRPKQMERNGMKNEPSRYELRNATKRPRPKQMERNGKNNEPSQYGEGDVPSEKRSLDNIAIGSDCQDTCSNANCTFDAKTRESSNQFNNNDVNIFHRSTPSKPPTAYDTAFPTNFGLHRLQTPSPSFPNLSLRRSLTSPETNFDVYLRRSLTSPETNSDLYLHRSQTSSVTGIGLHQSVPWTRNKASPETNDDRFCRKISK